MEITIIDYIFKFRNFKTVRCSGDLTRSRHILGHHDQIYGLQGEEMGLWRKSDRKRKEMEREKGEEIKEQLRLWLRKFSCSLVTQLCPAVWDTMDCSPPGSSVHGISKARILEYIAIPFSIGSFQPRDRTRVCCFGSWTVYHWATREALIERTGMAESELWVKETRYEEDCFFFWNRRSKEYNEERKSFGGVIGGKLHTYLLHSSEQLEWAGVGRAPRDCQRPLESARGEVTGSQPNSPSQRGAVGPPSILEMILPSLCICSVPVLAVLDSLGVGGQRIQGLSWLWGLLSRTEQRCREGIRHNCELQRGRELRPESLGLVEGGRVDFAGVKWGCKRECRVVIWNDSWVQRE